jgi:hemerythrin-like metal-binding protein
MPEIKDALPWSKKYELGFAIIDSHHKELVTMINTLNRAMKSGKANETIIEIFGQLNTYVVKHFQYEERHFEKYNFVGAEAHIAIHDDFKNRVSELTSKYLEDKKLGMVTVDKELITFLVNWLMTHIIEEDGMYQECFKENGMS